MWVFTVLTCQTHSLVTKFQHRKRGALICGCEFCCVSNETFLLKSWECASSVSACCVRVITVTLQWSYLMPEANGIRFATGTSRLIGIWISEIRIPRLFKSNENHTPISAMLICTLNSKFAEFERILPGVAFSNKAGITCIVLVCARCGQGTQKKIPQEFLLCWVYNQNCWMWRTPKFCESNAWSWWMFLGFQSLSKSSGTGASRLIRIWTIRIPGLFYGNQK